MEISNKKQIKMSIIIGIILFIINCTAILVIDNALENAAKEQLLGLIKKNGNILSLRIDSDLRALQLLADKFGHQEYKDVIKYINDNSIKSESRIIYEDVLIANKNGKVKSILDDKIYDISESDYLENSLKGETYASRSILKEEKLEESIVYSTPIYKDNEINEVLIIRVNIGNLIKYLNINIADNDTCTYIVDEEGDIISRYTYHDHVHSSNNIYDIYTREESPKDFEVGDKDKGTNLVIRSKNEGKEAYLAYEKIPNIDNYYVLTSIVVENMFNEFEKVVSVFLRIVFLQIVIYIMYFIYARKKEKHNINILKQVAYKDELLGIYNFKRFKNKGQKILSKKESDYSIIKININNFKYINGQFGHSIGDKVLKYISGILIKNIYEDEICARDSDDKFILMLKHHNDEEIKERIKNIECLINVYRLNEYTDKRVECTYYVYNIKSTDEIRNIEEIIDDLSIYKSIFKQEDHMDSCIIKFYDDDVKEKLIGDKKLQDDMKKGIENNEFKLYVQPKYDVNAKNIRGGEVLIRWDKEGTLVFPDRFIPLFEQNRSIIELDMYVLRESCKYIRKWIDEEYDVVCMAVNVSKITLYTYGFAKKVNAMIEEYNIHPSLIEIEITESVDYENIDLLIEKIKNLKNIGVSVSIDDFGSGYSSFNLLTEVPVDTLKIDKNFLLHNKLEKNNEIIIKSIVTMASELGLIVVAEGVETDEQLNFLRNINCDIAQGYLLDRPMDINEFEKRLSK